MSEEKHTIKNKILLGIALLCVLGMVCLWTGKDEQIAKKEDIKIAEEVSLRETEVLAHNAAMETIDGRAVAMRDLYNKKPVYVFFWMPWSDDSKKQLPAIEEAYLEWGRDVYFVIVSVGSTQREARAFFQASSYTMPFYTAALAMARDYNVYEVPQSIIIGKGGTIKKRHIGVMTQHELAYFIAEGAR